jgi:hypothetical protein
MTAQGQHYEAAMAAIAQVAEVQAMHSQFTTLCDQLFDYAQSIRNTVIEQVIPVIINAVGDSPNQSGATALALMQIHQEADLGEAMAAIQHLRGDIMHDGAYGKTVETVAWLEAYSQGL